MKYGPYSPSRLEVARCPYRFQREYINRTAPKLHSEPANRGNVVHLTQEKMTNSFIKGVKPTATQVHDWLNEAIDKYPLRDSENYEFVRQACLNYLEDKKPFRFEDIVGVEEELAVSWKDGVYKPCDFSDPKAVLRGKLDIFEIKGTTGCITDHKNQRNVETADTFQQGCYAFMAKIHYPYLDVIETRLHFCAPELNFYSSPAIWGPEELEMIRKDFERMGRSAESVEKDSNEAYAGHHCRYCPVMDDCPLKAKIAPDGQIQTPGVVQDSQTAIAYAEYYVYMEQYMKKLKKHLQDYVKLVGPVPLSNMIAELRLSESHNVKKQGAIRAVLAKHNVPAESFSEITAKGVKRLVDNFEDNPEFVKDLMAAAPLKHSQRFGAFVSR